MSSASFYIFSQVILSLRKAQLRDEGMSRRDLIFLEVVGENFKIKELATTVSPRDQKRFHDRIKADYREQISSKPLSDRYGESDEAFLRTMI